LVRAPLRFAAFCNLNSLPRWCHVLCGLEFSAVKMKEHDA